MRNLPRDRFEVIDESTDIEERDASPPRSRELDRETLADQIRCEPLHRDVGPVRLRPEPSEQIGVASTVNLLCQKNAVGRERSGDLARVVRLVAIENDVER